MLTFRDIYRSIARQLGDMSTSGILLSKEVANRVQRMLAQKGTWPFLCDEKAFVLSTAYTTGTVNVTQYERTIAGNGSSWTHDMVGSRFRLSGVNIYYRISGFTSTTTLTLDRPYQGTTAVLQDYEIYKNEYELDRDTMGILNARIPQAAIVLTPGSLSDAFRLSAIIESAANPYHYYDAGRTTTAYHNAGTVTVTQGSATLAGTSSVWDQTMIGRMFRVKTQRRLYRIASYTSAVSLTLEETYKGDNEAAVEYEIDPAGLPKMLVWPRPSNAYHVYYWRKRNPRYLTEDEDVADFPDDFHDVIVSGGEYVASKLRGDPANQVDRLYRDFNAALNDKISCAAITDPNHLIQAEKWGDMVTGTSFPSDYPPYARVSG